MLNRLRQLRALRVLACLFVSFCIVACVDAQRAAPEPRQDTISWNPAWGLDETVQAPKAPQAAPVAPPRSHYVWAKVTAYCPCDICCPGSDGHTSIGVDVHRHPYGIAADPKLLPYGTLLRVPGYLSETFPGAAWPVDDTGSAMRADGKEGILHIDLRYRSHQWARQQGVRYLWVEIVDRDI